MHRPCQSAQPPSGDGSVASCRRGRRRRGRRDRGFRPGQSSPARSRSRSTWRRCRYRTSHSSYGTTSRASRASTAFSALHRIGSRGGIGDVDPAQAAQLVLDLLRLLRDRQVRLGLRQTIGDGRTGTRDRLLGAGDRDVGRMDRDLERRRLQHHEPIRHKPPDAFAAHRGEEARRHLEDARGSSRAAG